MATERISGLWRAVDDRVLIYIHNGASAREFRKIILSDAAMTNISAEGLLSHAVRSLRCNFDARGHKFAKPRSDRIVVEFRALKSPISSSTIGLGGKIMGFSFAAKLRP
jgi:hypothetical protein